MEAIDVNIISATQSVCPKCLRKVPAQRVIKGNKVYLVKTCPEHGDFQTLLWRGSPNWDDWVRPTIPSQPLACFTQVDKGCPFDCGLCEDHHQHTCTALLEITQRCNLNCRYCFADAGGEMADPSIAQIKGWFENILVASGPVNVQLSGGEPTLREDLPEIIALGKELGFSFIQLNTNGLRLAQEPYFLNKLQAAGLSSVFLQFDGTEDDIYMSLRGGKLLESKIKAIANCAEQGIGVVLVPTLVPGVNTHNIGEIIKFALDHHPGVRGVHFQPVSYFGRIPQEPGEADRLTLPEVIRAIEEQTDGLISAGSLKPHNGRCSFSGSFIRQAEGRLKLLNSSCCNGPEQADEVARKTRAYVARQWSGKALTTKSTSCCNGSRQGDELVRPTTSVGAEPCMDRELPTQTSCCSSWDAILEQFTTYAFSVSGMAFQDAWNLDLERLKNCCIHVVSPEGKLVPFCAYNLTDCSGRSIYRRGR